MLKRHIFLSFFAVILIFSGVMGKGNVSYATTQDGLYFNLEHPVFISLQDSKNDVDRTLEYINKTAASDIVIIVEGRMTTFQDLIDKKVESAFYPIDLSKLKPKYTRVADGSVITFDLPEASDQPPEVEYIR